MKLALPLFAKRIEIINNQALQAKGPLILAVNHPNSFLDAILLGTFMQQPVHFITRGDVFKKAWVRRMLHVLHMIPIYRIRDGKDKLSLNEITFLKSVEVLRNNGVLLIFVEGFCEYQTTLQLPLKKGAPRILQACWQQGIEARVLPVWLQYSSIYKMGKTIHIRLGQIFGEEIVPDIDSATCTAKINAVTTDALKNLETGIAFEHKQAPAWLRVLLLLPAMLGAVLHAPLYLPISIVTKTLTAKTVHYDSVVLVLLTFLYPALLLVLAAALWSFTGQWIAWPIVLLGFPFLAWCLIKWKQ